MSNAAERSKKAIMDANLLSVLERRLSVTASSAGSVLFFVLFFVCLFVFLVCRLTGLNEFRPINII